MSELSSIRGPFASDEQFNFFKTSIEDADTRVRVERATDAEGRIFARIVKKIEANSASPSVNPEMPSSPPAPALDKSGAIPAGAPGTFVSARRTGPTSVLYIDAEGREVLREGGSRAWRNFNPGNIKKGDFAILAGAIGDDGTFGIFPDLKTGLAAITALLVTKSFRDLTLEAAVFRYAPPSENESHAYVAFVEEKSGVGRADVIGKLPAGRLLAIAEAIKTIEGWKAGAERVNAPASPSTTGASGSPSGISSAGAASGEWMEIALGEAALPEKERSEWPDPGENPRILSYFHVAAPWFEDSGGDETDWCAAFVNFCLIRSGHMGTNHPGARSFFWNKKGHFVALPGPVKGCIAVQRHAPLDDATWQTGAGHVGFVTSFTDKTVTLLGGNQGKTVKVATFPLVTMNSTGSVTSRFVAFMMPVAG